MGTGMTTLDAPAGQGVPLQRKLCAFCGVTLTGRQKEWCSDRCRYKAWDAKHPRLDFTPAASELAHAVRGRESKAARILARLRQGPANSLEMLRVGGIRYGARVAELRKLGHRIETEHHPDFAVYRLLEEPCRF